uniref:RanBP2-type domain-containing protein n=1 Tax=Caenorhabditis japonica TaxID=281687 RepID=A0A8R1HK71_CAEJA
MCSERAKTKNTYPGELGGQHPQYIDDEEKTKAHCFVVKASSRRGAHSNFLDERNFQKPLIRNGGDADGGTGSRPNKEDVRHKLLRQRAERGDETIIIGHGKMVQKNFQMDRLRNRLFHGDRGDQSTFVRSTQHPSAPTASGAADPSMPHRAIVVNPPYPVYPGMGAGFPPLPGQQEPQASHEFHNICTPFFISKTNFCQLANFSEAIIPPSYGWALNGIPNTALPPTQAAFGALSLDIGAGSETAGEGFEHLAMNEEESYLVPESNLITDKRSAQSEKLELVKKRLLNDLQDATLIEEDEKKLREWYLQKYVHLVIDEDVMTTEELEEKVRRLEERMRTLRASSSGPPPRPPPPRTVSQDSTTGPWTCARCCKENGQYEYRCTACQLPSRRFNPSEVEIRRMPASNAEDQRRARLPYRHPSLECQLYLSRHVKYTLFFFAPLWLVCSFTYQAALAFTSVSSLNLVSSSSSVFILAFSICFPSSNNRFSAYKCLLVAVNIAGVLIVSHYIPSFLGAIFAQISALAYAVYLFAYGHFEERYGKIDINLMFGTIGVVALVIGTPALNALDKFDIEPLHPLPNATQLSSILVSALIGTIVADYLWLLAAGMCDSLTASLSLTISIPLSFFADTIIRNKAPTMPQILASIPILLAFVGAAYAQNSVRKGLSKRVRKVSAPISSDSEHLIDDVPTDE